ncbi:MAG: aminotransferase class V-fold PLP-dependent enzyme [Haliscomenobacter sp.]|nr:aminotransferase class V-fold PLP-dependent enzyme [Haliscomenobacter sp.]
MTFNKSETRFPSKAHHIYLAHCGISPLYAPAAKRASELLTEQSLHGGGHFMDFYNPELDGFKEQAAPLLQTSADHIAAVRNTSEALSMVANGYPFQSGVEIITFTHEYPANFIPGLFRS